MKKSIHYILILSLSAILLFSACGQQEPEESAGSTSASEYWSEVQEDSSYSESSVTYDSSHKHSYTDTVTKATCTSKGYTTHTCSCGESYTDSETPALGHSFGKWYVKKEATATFSGIKERTCSRCSYCETASIPATTQGEVDTAQYAAKVIELVNTERTKHGLSPLKSDNKLNEYASLRSKELVQVFNHIRPDGSNPLYPVMDWGYITAGENIAYGAATPSAVMNGWMNSQGHRENILSPDFKYIGVGCYSKNGTLYWTQIFGGEIIPEY